MSDETLQQAITAIKAGNKEYAKQLLTQILEIDDNNEDAWLGMAVCADDSQLKRECLQRALEINPNSELAKRGLRRLDTLSKAKSSPRAKKRGKKGKKKGGNLTLVLVACIAVVCCAVWGISSSRTSPTISDTSLSNEDILAARRLYSVQLISWSMEPQTNRVDCLIILNLEIANKSDVELSQLTVRVNQFDANGETIGWGRTAVRVAGIQPSNVGRVSASIPGGFCGSVATASKVEVTIEENPSPDDYRFFKELH